MRVFISTGEVSGDLQGALLIEALRRQADRQGIDLEIVALGGDRMAKAGAKVLTDTTQIGSIGLLESIPYVLTTIQLQRRVKRYLRANPPDVVVMIDYFGPNLGIGWFVRKRFPQVPTVYYIAPQEWIWSMGDRNTDRILQISDRLLAIFQGEADYYQKRGGNVAWVGHPLLDLMQQAPTRAAARQTLGIAADQLVVALIPASRQQELRYLLPNLFAAAQQVQTQVPQVQFWIPLSLASYRTVVEEAVQQYRLNAQVVMQQSQTVIAAADLAIAKSGTVNLETALLNVPQVVVYRLSPLTAWIAYNVLKFKIQFASPPNLVLMKEIVPELLQENAMPEQIARTAIRLLLEPEARSQMQQDYQQMRQALGEVGVCDRAAAEILAMQRRSV
ncbi:MAG: lipid-A-disaccharide synthase [Oculatellaceae cyanobacterium Prado106]|jgi:lipid-A-disaccharide synthase|nr:lipid-A-disaccharide synthase [Oculatellaceae cyanobacterium Prado106]